MKTALLVNTLALCLSSLVAATPFQTNGTAQYLNAVNVNANSPVPSHEGWYFRHNFAESQGDGMQPYFEWFYSELDMLSSPGYWYAHENHGKMSFVIHNVDPSWLQVSVFDDMGAFRIAPYGYAIVGNIPPGGTRAIQVFPGCPSQDAPASACLGTDGGVGGKLEWSNDAHEGYINYSLLEGFNVGMRLEFDHMSNCHDLTAVVSQNDLLSVCPEKLRHSRIGVDGKEYFGCMSDCKHADWREKHLADKFCCRGYFGNRGVCEASNGYLRPFINAQGTYFWAFDDERGLQARCNMGSLIKLTYGIDLV